MLRNPIGGGMGLVDRGPRLGPHHHSVRVSRISPQAAEAFDRRAVVLVEGVSDQVALEALAERRGRNLHAEGVSVLSIGGAQAIGSFLELLGPRGTTSSWRGSATSERRTSSGAPSSGPASAPTSPAPTWNDSASTCASQTWRTN
jgi:hypothetical protein